jgi:hypothetical protein
MDAEVEFLHRNFTEKNPKLLIEHMQRMASGDAPFFSATLSLVYDKLIERVFAEVMPTGSGPGKSTEAAPTTKTLNPTASVLSPSTTNSSLPPSQPPPTPAPEPKSDPEQVPVWLRCFQCSEPMRVKDLFGGLRCPQCPSRGSGKGRPFMRCSSCNLIRVVNKETCDRKVCQARFV